MPKTGLKTWKTATVIVAGLLLSAVSPAAYAQSAALSASQAMFVHSFDGIGCRDIYSQPREGHLRSGSCVEFRIEIENTHFSKSADKITFNNPIDQNLVFVTMNKDGFVGGSLKMPDVNTDCGVAQCIVTLQDASLRPKQKGVLQIRAIVK